MWSSLLEFAFQKTIKAERYLYNWSSLGDMRKNNRMDSWIKEVINERNEEF